MRPRHLARTRRLCPLTTALGLQRLEAINRRLHDPHCHLSIGELALHWGFSDQAQFTRSFRQHFGCTASEVRAGVSAK